MYMVIFDDENGLTLPMTTDADCRGALCAWSPGDAVALFQDRRAARTAIDISAKFAALCKAQGTPANDDFLPPCRKFLRIVPCSANLKDGQRLAGGNDSG